MAQEETAEHENKEDAERNRRLTLLRDVGYYIADEELAVAIADLIESLQNPAA